VSQLVDAMNALEDASNLALEEIEHDLDVAELQLDAEKVAHATTKGQLVAAKVVTATTITENVKLFGDIVTESNVAYRPITTQKQHAAALKRIGQLWQAKLDTHLKD
jgi:hypothetical protein